MQFGEVEPSELKNIDFRLPKDPDINKQVLSRKEQTKFFLGCASLGTKMGWSDTVYPPDVKKSNLITVYSKVFNTIELNTTFYGVPTPDRIQKWYNEVGEGFVFCPKVSQDISHTKRLKNVDKETDQFLAAISNFKEKLGPILLLIHPQMTPEHIEFIEEFVEKVELDMVVEVRHPDFFIKQYDKDLFHLLREHGKSTVITDTPGRRDAVHMHLTSNTCYVRLQGCDVPEIDKMRMDEWVQRIKLWQSQGLEKCYFIFQNYVDQQTPHMVRYFAEQINFPVHFNDAQRTLF